jgi:hypothetical protein
MNKPVFVVVNVAVVAIVVVCSAPRAAEPAFRFQNNFWVNLHLALRAESRARTARAPGRIKTSALKADEREAWSSALDGYAEYGQRDLLFDPRLVRMNNRLTLLVDDATLDGVDVEAPAKRALTTAAPIYRAHFWAAQQQLNDRWISALQAMLAEHGAAMAAAMARVYGVRWPDDPILVDASAEAGPLGGYTTDGPPGTAAHTTIESANPEYQNDMGFEMVFHEASHARAIGGRIIAALNGEGVRQHVAVPRDLWHVLIFFTAGELAKRELGKSGDADYKPYAYRYGVYTRGWQKLRDATEKDWLPYLDGKTSWDDAIAAVVRDAQ